MAPKTLDIVVYGATGFTGRLVAKEVAAVGGPSGLVRSWAIAGRDAARLQAVLASVADVCRETGTPAPAVIVADARDADALREKVARPARVVVSCVGPFRHFGRPVVAACVAAGASYVDITGETEFIERMHVEYNDKARAEGVSVVPACGFDSVPSDMGVHFVKAAFARAGAVCERVELFIKFVSGPAGACVNATTFESAVEGFASVDSLRQLRRENLRPALPKAGKSLKIFQNPRFDKRTSTWTVPLQIADVPVIKLSQQILMGQKDALPPVQVAGYFSIRKLLHLVYIFYLGLLLTFLTKWAYTRRLLVKKVELFTLGVFKRSGPTQVQLEESSFETTLIAAGADRAAANGNSEKRMTARVSGPEMGYITTPRAVIACALTLLSKDGSSVLKGVSTPAAAFYKVADELIERLESRGIKFAIVSS